MKKITLRSALVVGGGIIIVLVVVAFLAWWYKKPPTPAGCVFVKVCNTTDLPCINDACKVCGSAGTIYANLPKCLTESSELTGKTRVSCCPLP